MRLSGHFCEHQQTVNGTCCIDNTGSSKTVGSSVEQPILQLPILPAVTDLLEQIERRQRSGAARYHSPTSAIHASCLPAFVEFDMSVEGFGCLFLPSLAPQKIFPGVSPGVGGETGMLGPSGSICAGGVGVGE